MRNICRIFLVPFIAVACLCSIADAAPRRVLPAAISAATTTDSDNQNHAGEKKATLSTRSRTATTPGVKSRATTSENMSNRSNVSRTATASNAPVVRNVSGRAKLPQTISNRNVSGARPSVTARAGASTATAPNTALQSMLDTEEANKKCLESYTQCMDNYCNVLDAGLGRCSCSDDTVQFSKISDALSATNVELQNVIKQISYIGLSVDEIEAMYTQTAGESVLATSQDTSKTKSDLAAIKNMLVDLNNKSNAKNTASNDISGLLNVDLTQNNFGIADILGGIGATNSSPLNNQRGEQLYKSAAARCKSSILKNCIDAQPDVVESQYKMEINRACTAYGKALQEKNDQARRMVDNTNLVLQKARLRVQSDKNSYDLRGCVSALDTCMRDDFVCGANFDHCLDATGRYFVSGALVSGKSEDEIMKDIWGVSNPGNDSKFITSNTTNGNIAQLIAKIGNPIRHDGMCSNVLNKCQNLWRDGKSDSYNTMNNVVLAWLGDAIPKMVVKQRTLISDFRADCVSTVNTCMTRQGVPNNLKPRNTQFIVGGFLASQVGACRAQIDMCANITNMTPSEILTEYIQSNVCSEYEPKRDLCRAINVKKFAILTTADTIRFSFDISAKGNFVVDWGDGTTDKISRTNTIADTYSHKYASRGQYQIKFDGGATGYSTDEDVAAISFTGNENIAEVTGSLGVIFPTLDNGQPRFYETFFGCSNLTSISGELFIDIFGTPTQNMFAFTFMECTSLRAIPSNLFSGISGPLAIGTFWGTFAGCVSLIGQSAKTNGKYLYYIWPDATADQVGSCYYYEDGDSKLSDYANIPKEWTEFYTNVPRIGPVFNPSLAE